MAEVLGFDRKGAKRVVDAVRRLEAMAKNAPAVKPPVAPSFPKWTAKGVTQIAIPYRGSGNVAIWRPNALGVEAATDPAEFVLAYAWAVPSGKQIKSGDECFLLWCDGRWYAAPVENCLEDIP